MRNLIKRQLESGMFRNMLIYGLGALFLKGISFFLIPLYTRMLLPEDYGNLELLNTFTSIIEILCSLGLFTFLYMDFFHKEGEGRIRLINTILSIYLVISTFLYILTGILLIFLHTQILGSLSMSLIYIGIITSYLNFFQGMYILVLKLTERAKIVTYLQITIGIISMGLNIVLVYYMQTGISGIIWANGISMLVSLLIISNALRTQFQNFFFTWDIQQIKTILRLSLPFVPGALSYWFLNSANRWILLHYGTLADVGLFSLAIKFTSIFDPLIIQPFLNANNPRTLKNFSEGNFVQRFRLLYPGVIIVFLILSFLIRELAGFMIDPSYAGSLPLIPVMVTGVSLSVLAQVTALLLLFRKRSVQTFSSILAGSLVSIVSSFLLVPRFGSMGAAAGTLLGNFFWLSFIIYFYHRERKKVIAQP
ncbi:MAG TPA: polysaccharide biosynthesis C-terminal domain-containing protein [Bacteroidia bacterium]|nr:polysaccharide biosynthesis C-terminal domain-containing protein [Bacteroidia bacterium]